MKEKHLIFIAFLLSLSLCAGCSNAGSTFAKKKDKASKETENTEENTPEEMTVTAPVQNDPVSDAGIPDEANDSAPTSEEIEGNSKGRVAMIADTAGINDHSFNQAAWDGLVRLNDDTGATVKYITTANGLTFNDNIETLLSEDYSLIWGVGYTSADALLEAATKHPDRNFAVLDHSFENIADNLTGVTFRAEEPSFMAGYIAASVSKSGRTGFIGGMESATIDAFRYGFEAGVAYANKELSKNVTVDTQYADSFDSAAIGKEMALKMYEDGCDVIFHAAGNTGTGVIEAARELGPDHFVIGVDRDQSYLAPDNVLTSVLKNVTVVIENVSVQYMMNSNIGGISLDFGLSEHAVGLSENHDNYSDEIYEKAVGLGEKIASNTVLVPKNEAEFNDMIINNFQTLQ